MRSSGAPIPSTPSIRIDPDSRGCFGSCRPSTAIDETLLPEPDSPTMPRVLPRSTAYERSVTACTRPSWVGNLTVRFSTTSNGSSGLAGAAMSSGRSVMSILMRAFRGRRRTDGEERPSGHAHPRIQEAVEDIDQQVGDDDRYRGDQHGRADHAQIDRRMQRVQTPVTDTVDPEDLLGEDGPREESGEVESEDRDDRHDRRPKGVLEQDPVGPHPLGLGGSD